MHPQILNGKPHLKNTPCPEFTSQFLMRVQDVIDSYDPDLLYFDDNAQFDLDAGAWFAPDPGVGLGIPHLAPQIMAYYYNRNIKTHGGRPEAVLSLKTVPEPVWGTLMPEEHARDFGPRLGTGSEGARSVPGPNFFKCRCLIALSPRDSTRTLFSPSLCGRGWKRFPWSIQ